MRDGGEGTPVQMVAPSQIGGGACHLKTRVTAHQKHKNKNICMKQYLSVRNTHTILHMKYETQDSAERLDVEKSTNYVREGVEKL